MSDIRALGSALATFLGSAGTVWTEGTVPAYYALAPQGGSPPYLIFNRQAGRDEYTFTSSAMSADYAIKVVSNRNWPGEAQVIYDRIHGTINQHTFAVSGYTLLRFERESTFEFRDNDGFWHVGGMYRVEVR